MTINIEFLKTGSDWGSPNLQYSFLTSLPGYYAFFAPHFFDFALGTETQLTANSSSAALDQQDIVRFLLDDPTTLSGYTSGATVNSVLVNTANTSVIGGTENYRVSFSDVIDATFSEDIYGGGDIMVINQDAYSSSDPSTGYIPSTVAQGIGIAGDVIINSLDTDALSDLAPGEYGFWLHLHELAHAIGGLEDVRNTAELGHYVDNQKYTVMSDNTYGDVYASGLGLLDIAALQDTYGTTNTATRSGNTTYSLGQGLGFYGANDTDGFLYTIWDGGGTDTIDASGFYVRAEIDLREGHFSSIGRDGSGNAWNDDSEAVAGIDPDPGNVAIAYGTVIENAIGTDYNDIFHGVQGLNNEIDGGDGDDTIDYSDAFAGVTVDLYAEEASDDGDGGTDVLVSIERVRGSDHNDTLTGTGTSLLYGSLGSDTISGFETIYYLQYAGIDVTVGPTTSYVVKGPAGVSGTDTLTDAYAFIGTASNDTFTGTHQDGGSGFVGVKQVYFEGGSGSDTYNLDLSTDSGILFISDEGAGFDVLNLHDFNSSTDSLKFEYTVDLLSMRLNHSGEVFWIRMFADPLLAGNSLDVVTLNGQSYQPADILHYLIDENLDYVFDDDLGNIYNRFYSGGGGNGMLPTIDGADVTSIQYSPSYGGVWVPSEYATEIFQTPVITDSTWSAGAGSIATDSYLQSLDFHAGISIDDLRFTLTGSQGAMDLQIHIDSLAQTFTIPDFETGKSISGVDVLTASLHGWIQSADTAALTSMGDGLWIGDYTDSVAPTIASGTVEVTYYLQQINAGIDSIDMTESLTFKGTDSGNILYGLDNRGDALFGLGGGDDLYGFGGDDTLYGGAGNDLLYGGDGDDTVSYAYAAAGVTVSLAAGTATGEGSDTLSGFENVEGSAFNDTILGSNATNYLYGGDGSDTFLVDATAPGIDGINAHGDFFYGGSGLNAIDYTGSGIEGVTINLSNGLAVRPYAIDTLENIDVAIGTDSSDWIEGNNNTNLLYGGEGEDYLYGAGGDDLLDGGDDFDVARYDAAAGSVEANLTTGEAVSDGDGGSDILIDIEGLTGSYFDDILSGDGNANWLYGEDGLDVLWGGGGADIFGFESAFAFTNVDVIQDFNAGDGDALDLGPVLDGYFDPLTEAITDFLQITTNGSDSEVRVDLTGSHTFGSGTMIALLEDVTGLTDEAALLLNGNIMVWG